MINMRDITDQPYKAKTVTFAEEIRTRAENKYQKVLAILENRDDNN